MVWNQARWVASENFIEITPRAGIQPQALLAVLNASVSEIALRVNALEYGGVYSLNPRSVGEVPVVDLRRLEPPELQRINEAYKQFLRINGSERGRLDTAVFAEAGLPDTLFQDLQATLGRMRRPVAGTPPAVEEEGALTGELRPAVNVVGARSLHRKMGIPGNFPKEAVGVREVARVTAPEDRLAGLDKGSAGGDRFFEHSIHFLRRTGVVSQRECTEARCPRGTFARLPPGHSVGTALARAPDVSKKVMLSEPSFRSGSLRPSL